MQLKKFGYLESRDSDVRRSALARAVRSGTNSYNDVYNVLSQRLSRTSKNWKEKVLKRDRNWLLERAEKRGVDVF